MESHLTSDYPGTAAYGADFFSRNAKGKIYEDGPDGKIERDERVIVTDIDLEFEGIVCVGERTIRHFAHVFGMVDGWRVDRLKEDNQSLRDELVTISNEAARLRDTIHTLRSLEPTDPEKVYLALDMSEHVSARAAAEQTARLLGCEPSVVLKAVPVPSPVEVSP